MAEALQRDALKAPVAAIALSVPRTTPAPHLHGHHGSRTAAAPDVLEHAASAAEQRGFANAEADAAAPDSSALAALVHSASSPTAQGGADGSAQRAGAPVMHEQAPCGAAGPGSGAMMAAGETLTGKVGAVVCCSQGPMQMHSGTCCMHACMPSVV